MYLIEVKGKFYCFTFCYISLFQRLISFCFCLFSVQKEIFFTIDHSVYEKTESSSTFGCIVNCVYRTITNDKVQQFFFILPSFKVNVRPLSYLIYPYLVNWKAMGCINLVKILFLKANMKYYPFEDCFLLFSNKDNKKHYLSTCRERKI